jgi:hypothetical protein
MATTPKLRLWLALVFVVGGLLAGSAPARGKKPEPYALIFGTVFDAKSQPIAGVKVKIARLKGNEKDKTWEHVSDARGEFAQRVPAGAADYLVWAELKRGKSNAENKGPGSEGAHRKR